MSSPPVTANVPGRGGALIGESSSRNSSRECIRSHSFSSIDSLEPSLIIIVLILLMTALISVSLCLILRHLNRQCLRRLSPSSSASSSVSTELRRFSGSHVLPETVAFSLVDALPRFTFSSLTRRLTISESKASSAISGDCAICLSKFEPHDQLRLLPLCCHAFHVDCADKWLVSNNTCPLCRSPVLPSDSDVAKAFRAPSSASASISAGSANGSFRIEIGSISRRLAAIETLEQRSSYSLGSFQYVMEDELEVSTSNAHLERVSDKEEEMAPSARILADEVGSSSRNWLRDYIDRFSHSVSSRALSFCGSDRFVGGSNRMSEAVGSDLEANQVGEEISQMFRWLSVE